MLGSLCRDAEAQAIAWRLLTTGMPPASDADDPIVERMRAAIAEFDLDNLAWDAFYEAFVHACDPRARRQRGVYVTPVPVVGAQVRLIDDVLKSCLGRARGLADPGVVVVDPAAGTGAYPLAVIDAAGSAEWSGRLHLFEPHAGAAEVARRRVAAALGSDAASVRVLDVLAQALDLAGQLVVVLGNPPYERHGAAMARKGGWVRFGHAASGQPAILEDVLEPARKHGHGVHLKSVFNDYVYFWRWAVWAVCERRQGPGVVSLLTPASYLRGPGFSGLRALLRRAFDEVWIVDLEGDRRAARRTDNVFAIRTPIAIAIAARAGAVARTPARVRYARLDGSQASKLAALDRIDGLAALAWQEVDSAPNGVFIARRTGDYARWPRLTELFPWQTSGCQMKRTWPIGPTAAVVEERWRRLLHLPTAERAAAFRPTRDRTVASTPHGRRRLAELEPDAPAPAVVRYAYRSFDRQWLLADERLGDFMRPILWRTAGPRQVFLTSLLSNVLGPGPAAVVAAHVPDLDHFRGSFGGRAVIPLWCDAEATRPNVAPGLLERLSDRYGRLVTPEDLFAYCYALLHGASYVARFAEELREPGPRVPLTPDGTLFARGAALGRRLVGLHTFGERFGGVIPPGRARWSGPTDVDGAPRYAADSETLSVAGQRFDGVSSDVWNVRVSGLRVVRSWLGYRVPRPRARAVSPLDRILPAWSEALSAELLELLWVLEATLDAQPSLTALLDQVVERGSVLTE